MKKKEIFLGIDLQAWDIYLIYIKLLCFFNDKHIVLY